jgi:hypothetical protein
MNWFAKPPIFAIRPSSFGTSSTTALLSSVSILRLTFLFSSGDSVGATVAESESDYKALVKSHPSTILALNHETYGPYLAFVRFLEFSI